MRVIIKEPWQMPRVVEIPNTLEGLQEAVGGPIEHISLGTGWGIICDEEGRLRKLPYNGVFFGVEFYGPILIVGHEGEEFCDFPKDAAELILRSFGRREQEDTSC